MRKQMKKSAFLLLATTLAITPLLSVPQGAYAASDLSIDAKSTKAGEKTTYTIKFESDKKTSEIEVDFDSDFDLSKVETDSVEVNGKDPKDVTVKKGKVTIKLSKTIGKGDDVKIIIKDVINPDKADDYKISVDDGDSDDDEKIEITKGSSSKSGSEKNAFSVSLGSSYSDEKTSIELSKFTLEDKLDDSKYIEVIFPESSMVPSRLSTDDVEINGHTPKDVSVSGRTVKIKPSSKDNDEKKLEISFKKGAGFKTPSSSSSYKIEVEYKSTTYTSKEFDVKKGSSSVNSDYSVSLSDSSVGARTSVSMELRLKEELRYGNDIYIEFPSQDMVPGYISASSVTINGTQVSTANVSGRTVSLRTPSNFSSTDKIRVDVKMEAFIKNPTTSGSYDLAVKHNDVTYRSKSFTVSGTSVTPTNPTNPTYPTNPTPTPVPVPVNNSAATVKLSKPNPNAISGMTVGIKALGVGLSTNDYIEVAMPTTFRVPTTIPTNAVTVNGAYPSFVGTRGQNLVIYPSLALPAGQAVSVTINENAKIQTPAASNVYNIGVYTSEERNPLFIRQVIVGAQNGVSFKVGTASYKAQGKTFPLAVAPLTVNGNTMVPATFVRDGLKVSTSYTKTGATVKSGNTTMVFKVGSKIVSINGKNYTMTDAVQLKNNVPMLPIRTITDNLRFNLAWDEATSSVVIFK
ncbi:stalk domain-containing protein [Brevibacillus sp. VP]|uniref:stalk domain-containing protein n=1 Tax=unclassified Brevibacillus TaxID=2684853 RepID=UPI000E2EFFFB|nr:stalk domain-containing protein [Brevibacillus sp. VP]RFB35357.1 copper amine oxidase N-terminal domain-containing protein [Brevibacillus sp. VP]